MDTCSTHGRIDWPIKDGLDAMRTQFFQKDGIVTDSRDVVAWGERRAYAETAIRALGIVVDKEQAKQTDEIKVNIVVIGRGK
jgi:hypothetical protein